MRKELKNIAYIDGANLYEGCKGAGFKLDYVKFRAYLAQRLGVSIAYIFLGYVEKYKGMYADFQKWGYIVTLKPTIEDKFGMIKGNCDSELVLRATVDFFEKKFGKAIIVTSDGDFTCLVRFFIENAVLERILSPSVETRCSRLLRETGGKLTFLPDIKDLISWP